MKSFNSDNVFMIMVGGVFMTLIVSITSCNIARFNAIADACTKSNYACVELNR